ncbi:IPT/TIG domain-containing protein [Streptomyces sp. NPDC004065]|uniref:IPT/TIG domain-containing protein n=1 Tax=Streptomyces sp. NPDC004065 TaxID=3364689 RepID=UPI00384CB8A8
MAAPVVSSVSPSQGPASGGTTVTVTGTGFTGATTVRFGTRTATSFTVDSSTRITAVAPSGTGTVTVTVTTGQGTSSQTVTYTYTTAAVPTLTDLTPSQGPVSGGTAVTLTGAGLSGATAVRFDTVPAASFTVDSATRITAVTPAHTAGAAAVTVTTPGGTSSPDAPQARFYFVAAPSLTDLTPSSGPTTGGTTVTLTGNDLLGATAVRFSGTAATSFTVESATQITAVAPAQSAGAAAVTVTTPGGTSNALPYAYLAAATLISLTPDRGPTRGGAVITLTGSNLGIATGVLFGSTACPFTVFSPSQITAVAPAGSAGPVSVTVTTPAGPSNSLTYTRVPAPSI